MKTLRKFAVNIQIDSSWAEAPPTEICLLRKGVTTTENGPYTFSDVSAKLVMAEFNRRGILYFADWHHASLDEHPRDPRLAEAAACHYKLEVRNGDLYATDIKWTPDGLEDLRKKRVLYISPAFDTNSKGEVVSFRNFALTNDPATHNSESLVAASAKHGESMDPEQLKAEYEAKLAQLAKLEAEKKDLETKVVTLTKKVEKKAEKDDDEDDDDEDDDGPPSSKQYSKAADLNKEIVRLHVELAKAKGNSAKDHETRVMSAHKKGLLPKASIKWALANAAAFNDMLTQLEGVSPAVEPAEEVKTQTNTRTADADTVKLCNQLGISVEEYLKEAK